MKIFVTIVAFTSLLLIAEAVNFKKDYCGNQEYVGNAGGRYPHMHCGKSFLTFSQSKSNHNNLQGRCTKVNELLGDREEYYGTASNPNDITDVLQSYHDDDCPVLLLQLLLNRLNL